MRPLSHQAFEAVTRLFHSVSGIQLGDGKQALVTGRLQRLASEAGAQDLEQYVERLLRGGAPAHELTRLIDRLTTNETCFFRELPHFSHLAERLDRVVPDQPLRVWSAACASGEEAYSAAMLLSDRLPAYPWQVLGTDLSTAMVAQARRGLYPMDRARLVPPAYLKRFCLKGHGAQAGQVLMGRSLRARVQFEPINLVQPLPEALPMFDVIFLRNVLIYFDRARQVDIVRQVLGRLQPDGLLYTGHAESLSNLGLPVRTLGAAVHGHA